MTTPAARLTVDVELENLKHIATAKNEPPPDWHNQRLEFLGDAVLKYIAGTWAFFVWLDGDEGVLTAQADEIKRNSYLRENALHHRFHSYLHARSFTVRGKAGTSGKFTLSDLRKQTVALKSQADIMEALIGAVYISSFDHNHHFPIQSKHLPPKKTGKENKNVVGQLGSAPGVFLSAVFIETFLDSDRQPLLPIFCALRSVCGGSLEPSCRDDPHSAIYRVRSSFDDLLADTDIDYFTSRGKQQGTQFEDACTCDTLLQAWLNKAHHDTADLNLFKAIKNSRAMLNARTHQSIVGSRLVVVGDKECKELPLSQSYQRLEFLGDSALSLLLTEWLYKGFPAYREGPLSVIKNVIQSNIYLAIKMLRRLATVSLKPSQLMFTGAQPNIDELQIETLSRAPENDFKWCLSYHQRNLKSETDESHGKDGNPNIITASDPPPDVYQSRYKIVSDHYEAMLAVFLIHMRFDVRGLWDIIRADFEVSTDVISSLLKGDDPETLACFVPLVPTESIDG
eukprot:GHVO01028565.1.p1 GENE.GHVO01028565.1~~GHVO01028565.1.p1  ORF type:complete len:511 (-),score=96.86 GHVO01028565.1:113-1645(-)